MYRVVCGSLRLRRRRRRRLFVFLMLFVVIDLFIAALAACLCGWLIRSARHGTARRTTTTATATTRPACLRVFDAACWAALADVRLGARSMCVRV